MVRFAPEVVAATIAAATDAAGPSLENDEPFWVRQAAFALTRYVWNEAGAPPDGLLVITRTPPGLLDAARRAGRPVPPTSTPAPEDR